MIYGMDNHVRLTHKPTGTVVRARIERSRSITQTKKLAMKVLRSIIAFGWASESKTVIRKYDLTPGMERIKDLRSGVETRDCAGVLDGGNIDLFRRIR